MATATKDCPNCRAENYWKSDTCQYCNATLGPWVPPSRPIRVTVVDLDLPFGSMVTLMVKWTIAAIPALIILALVGAMLAAMLGGLAVAG